MAKPHPILLAAVIPLPSQNHFCLSNIVHMQKSNLNSFFFLRKYLLRFSYVPEIARAIVFKDGKYGYCPDSVIVEEGIKNKQLQCVKHYFLSEC